MYQTLSSLISDTLRREQSFNIQNEPWYFINALPSLLTLFVKKYGSNDLIFLTDMKPHQIIKFKNDTFGEKDKIYTYYRLNNGKMIQFLESYTIWLYSKTIKFGAVTYSFGENYPNSYYDIEGVWLNNKLPIPLDVYYKENLVAQLYPYNGLEYMGGGASELYFNNNGDGLKYLDRLEFKYSLPGSEGKKLFSVTLDDVKCNRLFIGTVSSSDDPPYPDNAVYRTQKPNYSALTYFKYVGDGQSIMTNPISPFYS